MLLTNDEQTCSYIFVEFLLNSGYILNKPETKLLYFSFILDITTALNLNLLLRSAAAESWPFVHHGLVLFVSKTVKCPHEQPCNVSVGCRMFSFGGVIIDDT